MLKTIIEWLTVALGTLVVFGALFLFVILLSILAKPFERGGIKDELNELHRALTLLGVNVSIMPGNRSLDKLGQKLSWFEAPSAIIDVRGTSSKRNVIEYVFLSRIFSDTYTECFAHFIVNLRPLIPGKRPKHTKMVMKRAWALWPRIGTPTSVSWKGDEHLSGVLTSDSELNYRILDYARREYPSFTISIRVVSKRGFAKIIIPYFLSTGEMFEVITRIGRHIQSVYRS